MPHRTASTLTGLLLLALVGCAQPSAPQSAPSAPALDAQAISDGASGGNPHFFLLSPLPPGSVRPSPTGTFDPAANPTVTVCPGEGTSGCVATFSNLAVNDPYRVKWDTRTLPASGQVRRFRVRVLAGGQVLGFVDLRVTPKGNKTAETGTLSLEYGSALDLRFRVEVGARATIATSPARLDFGNYRVGTASTRTVTVLNTGGTPLRLTGVSLEGAGAAGFSKVSDTCLNVDVAPGANCRIGVRFSPPRDGTPPAEYAADLVLTGPAENGPRRVPLTGLGGDGVNRPPRLPHAVLVFPERDFISAEGYAAGENLRAEVWRGGTLIASASGQAAGDGVFEVNHPGGACWVSGTPDLRAGDQVRVWGADGSADATDTARVVTGRAFVDGGGVLTLRGSAEDAQGNPLPLDQIEARIIASSSTPFSNGRRSLRAPLDGNTLTYDAPGSKNWTARFPSATAADQALALESEARILWLGADPLAGNEATLYEVGPDVEAGPQAPCTGSFEGVLATLSATGLSFSAETVGQEVTREVRVSSGGDTPLRLDTATLSGAEAFSVNDPGCGDLGRGASCTFRVTYRPAEVGEHTAVLTLPYRDAGGTGRTLTVALAGRVAALAPLGPLNEPPQGGRSITAFPARDFVSAEGYAQGDRVTVEVWRGGSLLASAEDVVPQDDPATPEFEGLVEVNHPGGACWDRTPDLRAGDAVRLTTLLAVGGLRQQDQVHTANVLVDGAATLVRDATPGAADGAVRLEGTALRPDGTPFPAADLDQLEARIVATSADPFDRSGRRTLRTAPTDPQQGTFTYDPADGRWTAEFALLTAHDVDLAQASEARVMWLGRDPASGNELTIAEAGPDVAGGPQAPCTQ